MAQQTLDPTAGTLLEILTGCTSPTLVTGAPGTGKSQLLISVAVQRLDRGLDPLRLLMIAPTRNAAAHLRDELSRRAQRTFTEPVVRTWSAYAFDLIRRARVEGLLPFVEREPRLLSGPEQDSMIAALLEGHTLGVTESPGWPQELELAIGTRGFRKEVREFFDRVSELGLEPADVADLGHAAHRPEWVAAARFYQEYRDLLDLGNAEAFDPAGLITRAAELLEKHPDFCARERGRLDCILVDDLQEATLSQHRLLQVLGRDHTLIAVGTPDNVVQGFRGARPELVHRFASQYGQKLSAQSYELTYSYRMTPAIAEAWRRVVRRIPAPTGQLGRRLTWSSTDEPGNVQGHIFESATQEQRFLAQRIIEFSVFGEYSLKDIAVIVRNGSQVRSLSRFLEGQGIAVSNPPAELPLKDESAVRPLLDLLQRAVAPAEHEDPLLMHSLLISRYGMSTALEIRRIRQLLRRVESSRGGRRSSAELLDACLTEPELTENLGPVGFGLQRVVRMYTKLQEVLADGQATPETALWALWEASGRSDAWREEALGTGPAARRADHDLDAVLSLFQAAERFVDQLPGASVAQFLDYILGQDLPMDSLASRAQGEQTVTVLTTAAAAGGQWPVVFLPGLQEGSWPNLQLRGELLGSNALADAAEHGVGFLSGRTPAELIKNTRADELRSFANAVSRAEQLLVCTAVENSEMQASSFMDLVDPPSTAVREPSVVPRIRSLPTLVAELRASAERAQTLVATGHGQDSSEAQEVVGDALSTLALLSSPEASVRGAHPDTWWGMLPLSTSERLTPEGKPIRISPSKVETAVNSPLNWFVQGAGGQAARDFAASLGTLIHSIAEEHPDATGSQYEAILESRWPELEKPQNWESQREFDRAVNMLKKYAQYCLAMRNEGRTLVARELSFEVQVPEHEPALYLRGVMDRVELDAEGRAHVVDLKTGSKAPTLKETERHAQLGVYQQAIKLGALDTLAELPETAREPSGASLVYLGTTTKGPTLRAQQALGEESWATELILQAAALMGDSDFITRHFAGSEGLFGSCALPEICPLCTNGRQVTEP
ncbi:PD-(D/E)XK nuclease family protein [Glutamicibacter sp. PS]|uniref:ATP-dependent helicase n=1 Tax=Glutamicibacter sp. PS TaxID=3075634 RepID=UPI0028508177|nr:PD-(D/E)XK nuclease family protein [Glutamicibacter sp. PS]MDR4532355.1 PD-(D/E)XK nuclease family protein [Glutamicibacter sp. PS]